MADEHIAQISSFTYAVQAAKPNNNREFGLIVGDCCKNSIKYTTDEKQHEKQVKLITIRKFVPIAKVDDLIDDVDVDNIVGVFEKSFSKKISVDHLFNLTHSPLFRQISNKIPKSKMCDFNLPIIFMIAHCINETTYQSTHKIFAMYNTEFRPIPLYIRTLKPVSCSDNVSDDVQNSELAARTKIMNANFSTSTIVPTQIAENLTRLNDFIIRNSIKAIDDSLSRFKSVYHKQPMFGDIFFKQLEIEKKTQESHLRINKLYLLACESLKSGKPSWPDKFKPNQEDSMIDDSNILKHEQQTYPYSFRVTPETDKQQPNNNIHENIIHSCELASSPTAVYGDCVNTFLNSDNFPTSSLSAKESPFDESKSSNYSEYDDAFPDLGTNFSGEPKKGKLRTKDKGSFKNKNKNYCDFI